MHTIHQTEHHTSVNGKESTDLLVWLNLLHVPKLLYMYIIIWFKTTTILKLAIVYYTQVLGACVQPSSSLSNIVHVTTANKAMYALSEACVIIIHLQSLYPHTLGGGGGGGTISNVCCVYVASIV